MHGPCATGSYPDKAGTINSSMLLASLVQLPITTVARCSLRPKSAARGKASYVELMLTPDGTPTGVASSQIGQKVGWDGNFETTLSKLKANGIENAAAIGIKNLQAMEAEKNQLLKCGTPQADAGCSVTIRYVAQVSRNGALSQVFAQMVTGLALANDPQSKVVATNLVQGEDGLNSMQNFSLHMQMLKFLRPLSAGQGYVACRQRTLRTGASRRFDVSHSRVSHGCSSRTYRTRCGHHA